MKPMNLGHAVHRAWLALTRFGRAARPVRPERRSRAPSRIFISPF
jgi:hypothetical protein